MEEINRIEDQLRRAFEGGAWHGPALREALADVTAERAAARPVAGAHSIWEIVRHVAAWHGAVRRRLEGEPAQLPAEGDWPPVTDTSEAGWSETLHALEQSYHALRRTVAGLTGAQLNDYIYGTLGTEPDPPTGAGVSIYVTLHGVIQHDLYHAGQIALLKKW